MSLGFCKIEPCVNPVILKDHKHCFEIKSSEWSDERDFVIECASQQEMEDVILYYLIVSGLLL